MDCIDCNKPTNSEYPICDSCKDKAAKEMFLALEEISNG